MIFSNKKNISVNSKNYFAENDFEESQLINLIYNRNESRLMIVTRFAKTSEFINWLQTGTYPVSAKSDFRLLEFKTVSDVEIEGKWIISVDGKIDYNLRNSAPLLVDYIDVKDNQRIQVSFTSLTKIKFCFQNLLVQQRFGNAIKDKDKDNWDYFDCINGENFDFFDPFSLSILDKLN